MKYVVNMRRSSAVTDAGKPYIENAAYLTYGVMDADMVIQRRFVNSAMKILLLISGKHPCKSFRYCCNV